MQREHLKGKLQRREMYLAWLGRTLVDFTCRACLAVVPDPEKGCKHCFKVVEKQEAAKEKFKTFCEIKKVEKEALRTELGLPKRGRGRPRKYPKGYTLRRPRSDKGRKRGPRRALAAPTVNNKPVSVPSTPQKPISVVSRKRGRPKGSKNKPKR